ncbi:TniQ family protein [Aphanothece hegewaldii]|nr:TniQ family protein [Aphanothece hegewaldii]
MDRSNLTAEGSRPQAPTFKVGERLTFYESWDLTMPEIPPRSHLYNLSPIGVKTFNTESLTSYIGRLSYAHNLQPKALINELIFPIIKQSNTYASKRLFQQISQFTNNTAVENYLIIHHPFTYEFVKALEQLTCQSNLFFLTFLSLSKFFNFSPTKFYRRWCPLCYEEMLVKKILYDPLIWSIYSVELCLYHQQRLCSKCFYCQANVLLLSPPGYCSKCHSWLGSSHTIKDSNYQTLTENTWREELKIYKTVNSIDIFREITQNLSKNQFRAIQANVTKNIYRYLKKHYPLPSTFFDSLLGLLDSFSINSLEKQYFRYHNESSPPALSPDNIFLLGYFLKIPLIDLAKSTFKY